MNSLFTKRVITVNNRKELVNVTAFRTKNDTNGNPVYLVQVWNNRSLLWEGVKVKGYRKTTDNQFKIKSYNLEESITQFILDLETEINKYYL